MAIVYDVYWNAGIAGAAIDYSTPLASGLTDLSYTTRALARNSTYLFGVRARDSVTGLSEKNVDAITKIIIDANGNDITNQPLPPQHVSATPIAAGGLRVEWAFPWKSTSGPRPTGFRVYVGTGAFPDYSAPVASVAYREGQLFFRVNVTGLVGGQAYEVGVRAFLGTVEESNTLAVGATPISQAPKSVDAVTIVGTSQA